MLSVKTGLKITSATTALVAVALMRDIDWRIVLGVVLLIWSNNIWEASRSSDQSSERT